MFSILDIEIDFDTFFQNNVDTTGKLTNKHLNNFLVFYPNFFLLDFLIVDQIENTEHSRLHQHIEFLRGNVKTARIDTIIVES